ncbi:hypothetical protein [Aureimonas sp. AU40]|uniref:hypothetical protein n=1 Tax=Aureimonas sp. AU40 TaxID=1637747 RepID=UPI0007840E37|nr:hypothetical protein [Aureimonas sp. AU40]
MPLPNRVTPFGEIVADPARGLFMGNRGILHDETRRLGASRWRHPHWIICRLDYGTTRRALMAPGAYTELFFLDEATALAAGHRPCALCRPEAFRRFLACWPLDAQPSAKAVDAALHAARVTRGRRQVRYEAPLDSLPDGAMVEMDGAAWLVWRGRRHRWSPAGYLEAEPLDARNMSVLTPAPTVDVLRAGYEPVLHTSLAA